MKICIFMYYAGAGFLLFDQNITPSHEDIDGW